MVGRYLFHMARSQPWPRWDVTLPAPLCSAACCVIALAVEEAAGSLSMPEEELLILPAAAGSCAVPEGAA